MATSSKTSSTRKSASTAKKTSARKTSGAAKKTSARKTSDAEKPTPSRTTARKASARSESGGSRNGTGPSSKKSSASDIAAAAAQQLRDLSGKDPEAITGLERTEDGWRVEVDVVELRRVPATTDVIASYEVTLDESGELQGYRRLRRYSRGDARDE
jgi:hypothetical protein